MSAHQYITPYLEPFSLGIYSRPGDLSAPGAGVPTPLLDPESLHAAQLAYDDAAGTLRTRARAALRPGVLHSLANRILGFAIFGERDQRLLKDRALAHFP